MLKSSKRAKSPAAAAWLTHVPRNLLGDKWHMSPQFAEVAGEEDCQNNPLMPDTSAKKFAWFGEGQGSPRRAFLDLETVERDGGAYGFSSSGDFA